jgi:hypothetical protein
MSKISRKLSTRNGFGPIQKAPSEPPKQFDINSDFGWDVPQFSYTGEFELLYVLATSTLADKAGIRQISPLIGLMKLKYGNFGKKAPVSFVRIDSKLGLILPKMPDTKQWTQSLAPADCIYGLLVLMCEEER